MARIKPVAPLKTSFLVFSIIGFLISVLYIPQFSISWAFAFALLFFLMFIASMISMTRATPEEQIFPRLRKLH
jgi:hypothetical protein